MKESRNPFRLRRSENIDTDSVFLGLFEPGILDVITEKGLPETVQLIRSAAGGGKTSLLRLFTPTVLNTLHSRRSSDEKVKDLYARLQALGALDEAGPKLLGVMLQCGRNYAALQNLAIDQSSRTRLFFGLLNTRIILGVLRGVCTLKGLLFPQDLSRIQLHLHGDNLPIAVDASIPSTGGALYEWARTVEQATCAELDSFGPVRVNALTGCDSLFALTAVRPESLTYEGKPIAERIILMMDDIHKLNAHQRSLLIEHVIEARSRVGIWIAERFEALNTNEILAAGSFSGRDRDIPPVELEGHWRAHYARFEKHVMRVAEKRVRASTETDLDTFRSCLDDSLDHGEYDAAFQQAIRDVSARVSTKVAGDERFREWITLRESAGGTLCERAIGWRALEILIDREMARPQKGLFDDVEPLGEDELTKKDDSSVNNAAELFLAKEYELPYYFGPERIARLASLNIQQFLGLAGSLFEEVLARELLREGTQRLSAKRQHALMKAAALEFWNDIPSNVRHGRDLRALLDSIGRFCRWYTFRPTAPNDPGVGGTAIRMSERQVLLDADQMKAQPERHQLAELIASALAHNYLVADLDYKCKGDQWMVLNLNRLLCVHFDLPLGYGLYKERSLKVLCRWLTKPFAEPATQEALYNE